MVIEEGKEVVYDGRNERETRLYREGRKKERGWTE